MPSLGLRRLEELIEARRGKEASWCQIAPESTQLAMPPAFFLGDFPAELSYAFFADKLVGPVRCFRLAGALLSIDGVVVADRHMHWTTLLNQPDYYVQNIIEEMQDKFDALPVRSVSGKAVMLSGPGSHIYGHFLVDMLPRLHVLRCCGYHLSELTYIVPAMLPAKILAILRFLGIRDEQIVIHDERNELIELDELLLPTNLRRGNRLHRLMHGAVRELKTALSAQTAKMVAQKPYRRLFVSRRNADASRSALNRVEIEDIVTNEGFEIIYPETMSFAEQMTLFAQAEQLIGEYGSGLHNSVFMSPGAVVTALRGTSHHPGFIQSAIGQIFAQPTGYVLSPTPLEAIHQTFRVEPNAFRHALQLATLLAEQSYVAGV